MGFAAKQEDNQGDKTGKIVEIGSRDEQGGEVGTETCQGGQRREERRAGGERGRQDCEEEGGHAHEGQAKGR